MQKRYRKENKNGVDRTETGGTPLVADTERNRHNVARIITDTYKAGMVRGLCFLLRVIPQQMI